MFSILQVSHYKRPRGGRLRKLLAAAQLQTEFVDFLWYKGIAQSSYVNTAHAKPIHHDVFVIDYMQEQR